MTTRVPVGALRRCVRMVFVRCGLSDVDASTAMEVVCYADRHGFATHGVNALVNIYAPGLRSGRIDPAAMPFVLGSKGAVTVIDGGAGLGLVTMTMAVDLAGQAAREHGIGAVAVRNSTHFGAAGYYTHRLATAGLVGVAMTNCGAQGVLPPLGGAMRMLGTNPLSAAVPAGDTAPFVLDMSTSAVATGRVKAAHRDGRPVPSGWLIGRADGADVTDPAAYLDGTADVAWLGGRLATGGAKGFGLGLLVDLLCGPLAGAAFGPRREVLAGGEPADDRDIGHFTLAIDPAAFGDPSAIAERSGELLGTVAACPPAPYADGVTYPGAPEAAMAARADRDGMALAEPVVAGLRRLAADLDVELPEVLRS
ncbi:MAG TPA: Ldh family oxidoreductase [Pilimelia sp.]|nr:Ldh family oxidoreductase [Pilimelia sp.]